MWVWPWTLGWILVGAAAITLEVVALANSGRGDTLSEHAWAWLGVRRRGRNRCTGGPDCPLHPGAYHMAPTDKVTPRWTVRLARTVLILGMVWLLLHFVTGGWL